MSSIEISLLYLEGRCYPLCAGEKVQTMQVGQHPVSRPLDIGGSRHSQLPQIAKWLENSLLAFNSSLKKCFGELREKANCANRSYSSQMSALQSLDRQQVSPVPGAISIMQLPLLDLTVNSHSCIFISLPVHCYFLIFFFYR